MTVRLNKTEEKVKTFLREHKLVDEGKHICVCFSGGADSCVLLHILYRLQFCFGYQLSACHFNHKIRGAEADADEMFCKKTCEKLMIPFYSTCVDVPAIHQNGRKSLEETARDARYAWFESLGMCESIDLFATAHHKNDQAETVLFHILRGTMITGLSGIPIRRSNIIRPLLCLSRSEIERYATENAIDFQTDRSNFSEQYTRNYIRHKLLPMAERVNPEAVESLSRLSRYAAEDRDFFESLLPPYESKQDVSMLHVSVLRRIIVRNYFICTGKTLCFPHVEAICNLAKKKCDGKVSLPDGYHAKIADRKLSFEKSSVAIYDKVEDGVLAEGVTLLCGGALRITLANWQNRDSDENNVLFDSDSEFVYNLSTEILLSCDDICGMIRYRSRLPGDRLRLHGVNRSIKKLFSEQKIPIDLRRIIPVFLDDEGIFYVPFVGASDRNYTVKQENVCLLKVELAEEKVRKVVDGYEE